jgi:hypothetical protein
MKSARASAFKRFGGLDFSNSHFCFLSGWWSSTFAFSFLLSASCSVYAAGCAPHAHILPVCRLVFALSFPLGSFVLR